MAELDPPITDGDMDPYCAWLRRQLGRFVHANGAIPLETCRAEVDFSKNQISDVGVGKLLSTLRDFNVHIACLKLFSNQIGEAGVEAVCDFVRENMAEPLYEIHLSHNRIPDAAALRLVEALSQHGKYPPRRGREEDKGSAVCPCWIRLNHNWVENPAEVLRKCREELGVKVCTADSRQLCAPTKCKDPDTPLVHLYSFLVQSKGTPVKGEARAEAWGPRRAWPAAPSKSAAEGKPASKKPTWRPVEGVRLERRTR